MRTFQPLKISKQRTLIKSGDRPAYNVAPTLPTPQPYYPSTTPVAAVVVPHSTMAPPVYVPASSARPYSVTVPPTVYRSVYTCVLNSHFYHSLSGATS